MLKGKVLKLFLLALAFKIFGAGNEARTRDLNLGKVALYQLSYSRPSQNVILQFEQNLSSAPKSIFSRVIPRQNATLFFAGFPQHSGHVRV